LHHAQSRYDIVRLGAPDTFRDCPPEQASGSCAGEAILGQINGIGVVFAAGLLRVLLDQDPARARTIGHQWSASSALGLLHVQERAAEERTARQQLPDWSKSGEAFMTAKNVFDEHEGRVAIITAIAAEVKALAVSESGDEMISTSDPNAERLVYARAYQAWADCKIEGTADDIFETVQEVLDV
jgi:hypothetical protein